MAQVETLQRNESATGAGSGFDLHARISVLEQQIKDQKEATVIALAAADKAIVSAYMVAEKAVAKVELAAEKTYLEAAIASLKEAFNQQIAFQKDLTLQALQASDKAVAKAEGAAEKRFESVNEFRSTLADQQRDLATKNEVNLRFQALEGRINSVVEDAREIKGRTNVLDPRIEEVRHLVDNLVRSRDLHSGGEKQASDSSARLIAIIAILASAAVGIGTLISHFAGRV